jgi:hypothetical protein
MTADMLARLGEKVTGPGGMEPKGPGPKGS